MKQITIKQIFIAATVVMLFFLIKFLIWKDVFTCPFNNITGLYCPGCGGIRCLRHLLQGDARAALESNSLLVISFTSILFMIALFLKNKKRMDLSKCLNINYLILVLLLISVFTIVRNIPHYPFTILRP
jgi:magnesium-transporting ATPase (P-type)